MKCSNCGTELKDGTLVCPRCGARQSDDKGRANRDKNGDGGFKKAHQKSIGAIFALATIIILVFVIGTIAVTRVTNISNIIFKDTVKYNDSYYVRNSFSKFNTTVNSHDGSSNDNVFSDDDIVYDYDPETRIINSSGKDGKKLTCYKTPSEHIAIDENKGIVYVDNEIIFNPKSGISESEIDELVSSLGGKVVGVNEYMSTYQVLFDKNYSYNEIEQLTQKLKDEELFDSIMPNIYIDIGPLNSDITND